MQIDPRNKEMIDYRIGAQQRRRSRAAWVAVLAVLAVGLAFLYLVNHDIVTGWLAVVLGIAGVVGVFSFLFFLSTKPYGRSNTSLFWRIWW